MFTRVFDALWPELHHMRLPDGARATRRAQDGLSAAKPITLRFDGFRLRLNPSYGPDASAPRGRSAAMISRNANLRREFPQRKGGATNPAHTPKEGLGVLPCAGLLYAIRRPTEMISVMNEKLPIPCEHCRGTGIQSGLDCRECGGRGFRVMVAGTLQPNRQQQRPPRQQPQPRRRGVNN